MPGSSESGAVPNSSVTDPPVLLLLPHPPAASASASTTPRIPTKRSFLIADLSSFRCAHPACRRTRRLLVRASYRSPLSRRVKRRRSRLPGECNSDRVLRRRRGTTRQLPAAGGWPGRMREQRGARHLARREDLVVLLLFALRTRAGRVGPAGRIQALVCPARDT